MQRSLGIIEIPRLLLFVDGILESVKLLFEILLSIVLHPIAMILMWINVAGRADMSGFKKFVWVIVSLLWGLGPIVYVLAADGALW